LTLRFGASAAVTTVFLMAPLSALMVVLMFRILLGRGVARSRALGLALLFGFGTPVFFRTGVLNHNMMLMYTTFVAFHLLWVRPEEQAPASVRRRVIAGFLCGLGFALDYSGLIPMVIVFGYLIGARIRTASIGTAVSEAVPFAVATIPPVLFSALQPVVDVRQPVLSGPVLDAGRQPERRLRPVPQPVLDRRISRLQLAVDLAAAVEPVLAVVRHVHVRAAAARGTRPAFMYPRNQLILPRTERLYAAALFAALVLFCASNQYSRIQFNSGFRYLVPLVPTIFLAASDHLARLPRRWLVALAVPAVANSWVISMVREPVPESWHRVLTEGFSIPG
jgi:hypothetical protein